MSIADAVRARDLEARVAILEQHLEAKPDMSAPPMAPTGDNAELWKHVKLMQAQLNSLRAKVDRLMPPGPPGTADAA